VCACVCVCCVCVSVRPVSASRRPGSVGPRLGRPDGKERSGLVRSDQAGMGTDEGEISVGDRDGRDEVGGMR
jgi:hypothetical protein